MATVTYDKEITGLLVVDPYNDFIPREASYGTALGVLRKRMTALLICCRSSMPRARRSFASSSNVGATLRAGAVQSTQTAASTG